MQISGKIRIAGFFNAANENYKMTAKMTMRHSIRYLNELIGYQDSADFCEIWPEHSFDVVKPKCVGIF